MPPLVLRTWKSFLPAFALDSSFIRITADNVSEAVHNHSKRLKLLEFEVWALRSAL
jgi:hypothetical protein